jgi:crotonobetainyl-CoA:carnitine CoA-transferase CaiB-like acyl-CoA transferase
MTHATHAHNVMAHIALASANESGTHAGAGLLNGGVPCYDVYRTRDDRFVAVGALELKFWQTLCEALGRPDWATRHWSLGQAIGGADAAELSAELAARFRERTRDEWMTLLEPLDCCVAPVLTPAEAAAHPLFRGDAT